MNVEESASENEWYWSKKDSDDRNGPIGRERLEELAEEGTLDPEDLVWRKGFDEWREAGSVEEIEELFASPPPLPDDPSDEKDEEPPALPQSRPDDDSKATKSDDGELDGSGPGDKEENRSEEDEEVLSEEEFSFMGCLILLAIPVLIVTCVSSITTDYEERVNKFNQKKESIISSLTESENIESAIEKAEKYENAFKSEDKKDKELFRIVDSLRNEKTKKLVSKSESIPDKEYDERIELLESAKEYLSSVDGRKQFSLEEVDRKIEKIKRTKNFASMSEGEKRGRAISLCEDKVRNENDVVKLFGRLDPSTGGTPDEGSSYPGSVLDTGDGEYLISGFVAREYITTEYTYGGTYSGSSFKCKVKVTNEGAKLTYFQD